MKSLTTIETWVCGWTAGTVAAMVVPANALTEFAMIYAMYFIAVSVSLYLTLAVLLLMVKNEGSWWGW